MNSSDTNLENQNTEIKNSKKSNKGLIVILILIILSLVGYICYDKVIMKEESNKVVENNEKDKNVNIENGKDDIELEQVAQNLYKKISADDWEFVCSLPVPSHVAHNASSYGSYVDCSEYIGTGTYRVTATYDADGYQITRNSNERSF